MEAYYYQQMDRQRREVYHAMKTGFTALRSSFPVPRLDGQVLSEVFFQLRLDCPEIFYVTGFSYRYAPGAASVELQPDYLFDKGKSREHQQAMAARRDKLLRPALNLSPWEKERYVHDFICRNVRYDKLKKPYSHEIIGPLGQGVGVCEGIAKAVKLLCDGLGLWCVIAVSDAAPEEGIKYRHAWNILRLEGQYYHLDATFDNSLSTPDLVRMDYVNLDDRRLLRDHRPPMYPVPPCTDGKRSYYQEQKLSFTKLEEVANRARQAVRKKKPLVFHWRGGHLTREVLGELLPVLREAAEARGLHAAVSVNWPQAVLCVRFLQQGPQEELVSEEANEGELL